MDSFITIRRRDDTVAQALSPNQTSIYAKYSLPRLLVADAQAVPRHQEETYRQAPG